MRFDCRLQFLSLANIFRMSAKCVTTEFSMPQMRARGVAISDNLFGGSKPNLSDLLTKDKILIKKID